MVLTLYLTLSRGLWLIVISKCSLWEIRVRSVTTVQLRTSSCVNPFVYPSNQKMQQSTTQTTSSSAHSDFSSAEVSLGEYFIVFTFITFSIAIHLFLPFPSLYVIKAYFIYFVFQYAMARFLPGSIVKGLPLEDGNVLEYNCNGLQAYLITLVMFIAGGHSGWWKYSIVYDHLLEFVAVTSIFHWCYWLIVFIKGRLLKKREYTDGLIREIWLGAERNPRILGVDCKLFFDGRPSLLTWVVVAFSYASVQYEQYGAFSTPMLMYLIFSFLYMLDFFVTEDQFITGFEIYQERFGFMLCWGNFVW